MRTRVASDTPVRPLSTFETVGTLTRASFAISAIVVRELSTMIPLDTWPQSPKHGPAITFSHPEWRDSFARVLRILR